MIIREVSCCDFRQFYGTLEPIKFSHDKEKNVTVIQAENGAGKTTFLHMLIWCLYNKLNLPDNRSIVNERKLLEMNNLDETEVWVKLVIEDDGEIYEIKRIRNYKKTNGKAVFLSNDFQMSLRSDDGTTKFLDEEEGTFIINSILPVSLKDAFFLDGERIDTLSKLDSPTEMKKATHSILKLQEYESAAGSIKKVEDKIRREANKYKSNESIDEFLNKLSAIEKDLKLRKDGVLQCEKNLESLKKELEAVNEKLKGIKEIQEKQIERTRLESQKSSLIEKLEDVEKKEKVNISKNGFLVFSNNIIKSMGTLINEKKKSGELPSKIKETFLQELLKREFCICGTGLEENSKARKKIIELLENSVSDDLDTSFEDLKYSITRMENLYHNYGKTKKDLMVKKASNKTELSKIENKIKELGKIILDAEKSGNLESKRSELDKKIFEEKSKKKRFENERILLAKKEEEYNKKIEEIIKKDKIYSKLEKKIEKAKKIRWHIDQMGKLKRETSKVKLQKKIDEIYTSFTRKGYRPIISDDFTVKVYKKVGSSLKEVPLSKGERGVTSISFIGALTDLVRNESNVMNEKKLYPIVLDSPFGELDMEHRKLISEGLPYLAEQVIVLVSDSQWEGPVEKALKNKLGRKYGIKNYNPKKNPNTNYEFSEIKEEKILWE